MKNFTALDGEINLQRMFGLEQQIKGLQPAKGFPFSSIKQL